MIRRSLFTLFIFVFAVGCDTGGGDSNEDDSGGPSADTSLDAAEPDFVFADASDPMDGPPANDARETPDGMDIAFEDLLPMEIHDPCNDPPLGFGCPCTQDEQCMDGHCVQSWTGKVCTSECVEECPEGFTCSLIIGTCPDCQYLCMPLFVHLCRPCLTNNDCMGGEVATSDLCVDFGADGMYCGSACSGAVACPDGHSCNYVDVAGGIKSYQCVPDDGTCECSEVAIAQGASTSCFWENEHGACPGSRTCTEDGLTKCDAAEPGPEACNAQDDNCNGVADEEIGLVPCTKQSEHGACSGTELCIGGVTICDAPEATVEICDGKDNNCDGSIDENSPDTDGDGTANCVDEDDDNDLVLDGMDNCPLVYNPPQADSDFDMGGDACDPDDDNDLVQDSEDCQPFDAASYPGAEEVCDGKDNDCDLWTDEETCVDGNACTADVCDPVQGCLNPFVDLPCEDGDPCTAPDICVEGTCAAGPDVCSSCQEDANCNDGNVCTQDSCQQGIGCVFQLLGAVDCDDGDPCTTGETCATGVCAGGTTVTCDDSNPCTEDSCQAPWGCVYAPADGAACNDGNACTQGDTCLAGACQGLDPVSCDDINPCTHDSCVPAAGCLHVAQDVPCSDGNECTLVDVCVQGTCVGSGQPDCADGNLCTDDLCQAEVGCVNPTNSLPCNDGDACTLADICDAGVCAGPVTLDCDDDNPCTDDECTADTGCVHTLNTDFETDELNCGACGEVCPEYTVCEGGDCLLLAGRPCVDDGDCLSGACRLDWDLAGQFCAQDAVSCVYALEGATATQVSPGATMCGGTNGYRICSAGAWGPAIACGEAACDGWLWTDGQLCVDGDGCTPDPASQEDCSPFVCDDDGCLDVCVTDDQCADGFSCQNGGCIQGNLNKAGSILPGSEYFGPPLAGWVQCAGWTNTSNWDILTTDWIHSCAATWGQLRFRLHDAGDTVILDETFPHWNQSEMSNNLSGCNNSGYGTCGKWGAGKGLLIYKPNNGNSGCHGDDNSSGAVRIANGIDGNTTMGDNYVFLAGKRYNGTTRSHNHGETATSEIRWLGGSLWDGCNHDGRVTGYSIAVYMSE